MRTKCGSVLMLGGTSGRDWSVRYGIALVTATYLLAVGSSLAADSPQAPTYLQSKPEGAGATASSSAKDDAKSKSPTDGPFPKFPSGGYILVPLSDAAQLVGAAKKEWTDYLPAIVNAVAWPIAVGLIIWWVLRLPQIKILLTRASRNITQISVAGLEIKLSEGATATIEDLHKLIAQVPDTHKDWLSNTNLGPQFEMVFDDIKKYLTTSDCDSGKPLKREDFGSFRFTLHVPDVVLAHAFRQLVPYMGSDRGGDGRIFSMRTGIIGKAWRLQRSDHVSSVYTDAQLIELWGMTKAEAHDTSHGKKIHLAVLLRSVEGLPLAVLYGDSKDSKIFHATRAPVGENALTPTEIFDRLEAKVLAFSKARGLIRSLGTLEDARVKVKQLDVYERRSTGWY